MKRNDIYLIIILFVVGLLSLLGIKLYENYSSTGNVYAKVFYQDELILMIDLNTYEYTIYNTQYKDQVDVGRSDEGIFYVPGTLTNEMTLLYETDEYAKSNQIVGIKLQIKDGAIAVVYQESPKDVCELQGYTNSSLQPLVCLPNELVIDIYTNLDSDQFVPDSILE